MPAWHTVLLGAYISVTAAGMLWMAYEVLTARRRP
jgi:hypothetical protein